MNYANTNGRNAAIYLGISALLAVVTVALGFYLVPPSSRGTPFGLSLLSLVIGELFLGAQLARACLAANHERSFLLSLGGIYAPVAYLGVAAVLALLTTAGANEKLLVVLHVLLLLAAVTFLALGKIGSDAVDASSAGAFQPNGTLEQIKDGVRRLSDRAGLLKGDGAPGVASAIRKLGESVRYTYAQSDAGSAADDAEMGRQLEGIHQALARLESGPDPAAAAEITGLVDAAIVTLKRRNDGIARRR